MGDLWGVVFLVGLFVVPVGTVGVAVYLVLRLSRARFGRVPTSGLPGVVLAAPGDERRSEPLPPVERRAATRTALLIAISGICLPWVVGLTVKLWLDATGRPTYPVSSFLEPTAVVVLLTATVVQWCWPFLLLAAWVGSRHFPRFAPGRAFRDRLLLARITFVVGLAGAAILFVPVFRRWDVMYIFVPLAFFLLLPILAGYGAGLLVLRARDARRLRSGAGRRDPPPV